MNDFAFMIWFKNFHFDHSDSENLRCLAKTKKKCDKYFIRTKYMKMLQEILIPELGHF